MDQKFPRKEMELLSTWPNSISAEVLSIGRLFDSSLPAFGPMVGS